MASVIMNLREEGAHGPGTSGEAKRPAVNRILTAAMGGQSSGRSLTPMHSHRPSGGTKILPDEAEGSDVGDSNHLAAVGMSRRRSGDGAGGDAGAGDADVPIRTSGSFRLPPVVRGGVFRHEGGAPATAAAAARGPPAPLNTPGSGVSLPAQTSGDDHNTAATRSGASSSPQGDRGGMDMGKAVPAAGLGSVFDVVKSAFGRIPGRPKYQREPTADEEDDDEGKELGQTAVLRPPSLRTRVQRYFQDTTAFLRLDMVNALLSVIACLIYVGETYVRPQAQNVDPSDSEQQQLDVFSDIELAMSVVFAIDYLFRVYLSTPFYKFILTWAAMLDIVTVLPVFVTYNSGNETPFFRFVRVLRILRILRVHRAFRYVESEVLRQVFKLLLIVTSTVFVCGGLFQNIENLYSFEDPAYEFHEAVYFVIVSITTVGYGDISPVSTEGQLFVILMICWSFLQVPLETSKLLRKMEVSSQFKLAHARTHSNKVQVLVCGHVQGATLENFFTELLHDDHSNPVHHIVILDPDPPSVFMLDLLENPKFMHSLTFIQGSPIITKDLFRARVSTAAGVFLLANQFSGTVEEDDAKIMLIALSVKRYVNVTANRDIPMYVQLNKVESKEHFLGTLPSGMTATIVCVEQLKMNMLATAFVCPAVVTMIHNLVVSDDSEPGDDDPVWLKHYMDGRGYEIYRTKLASAFEGLSFLEASSIIYEETSTVMFGLEIIEVSSGHSKIFVNPGFMTIPASDSFKVMGFVIAKDEFTADLVGLGKGAQTEHITLTAQKAFVRLNRRLKSHRKIATSPAASRLNSAEDGAPHANPLAKPVPPVGAAPPAPRSKAAGVGSPAPSSAHSKPSVVRVVVSTDGKGQAKGPVATVNGSAPAEPSTPKSTRGSRRSCAGLETAVDAPQLRRGPTTSAIAVMMRRYYLRDRPSTLEESTIIRGAHGLKGHVIVVGSLVNLFHFVQPLRSRQLPDPRPIVFLATAPPPLSEWERISHFKQVYYMEGSPLSKPNLLEAGIKTAAFVVVLSQQPDMTGFASATSLTTADSTSIFYTQSIYRSKPSVHVVCELVDYNNTNFLKPELADFTETADKRGYQLSQHFASGTVYTSSVLDILLCQAFFNPSIVMLLEQLIVGMDSVGMGRTRIPRRGNGVSQLLRGQGVFYEGLNLDQLSSSEEERENPALVARRRTVTADGVTMSSAAAPAGGGATAGAGAGAGATRRRGRGSRDAAGVGLGGDAGHAAPGDASHRRGNSQDGDLVNKKLVKRFELENLASNAQKSRLMQIEVPEQFVGQRYEKLFLHLLKWRASVPLGLYVARNKAKGNAYPFVMTNPRKTHRLCKGDRIFVLGPITYNHDDE